ncbi:phosphatidylglycerophosphatase A [Paracoccus sp. Z118]|uniref:phosphatidylglycerophosphatase A family protein n=1 Tax=Paracoccus sp. Z118 TaxID=2851017 RepID=UPI001C2BD45E|nr:phosphatidylglycerophosphatase A [Paracoccus sp. Z118]MBV0892412.1 phosphatidylglycerophosphatase A [Paracoccus sp. Z118]
MDRAERLGIEGQIATLFGIGRLRPAPGTWASLVTIIVGYALHRIGHFPLVAAATLAVLAVGFWAVGRHTAAMTDKDRPEIVIDEMAGQLIALCATSGGFFFAGLPKDVFPWPGLVAPFLFFRLFDIWKPWLVGRADRRRDVAGVMLDDVWAGIFAALASIAAAGISHWLM